MKRNPMSEWFRSSNDGLRLVPVTWEGVAVSFGLAALVVIGVVLLGSPVYIAR